MTRVMGKQQAEIPPFFTEINLSRVSSSCGLSYILVLFCVSFMGALTRNLHVMKNGEFLLTSLYPGLTAVPNFSPSPSFSQYCLRRFVSSPDVDGYERVGRPAGQLPISRGSAQYVLGHDAKARAGRCAMSPEGRGRRRGKVL